MGQKLSQYVKRHLPDTSEGKLNFLSNVSDNLDDTIIQKISDARRGHGRPNVGKIVNEVVSEAAKGAAEGPVSKVFDVLPAPQVPELVTPEAALPEVTPLVDSGPASPLEGLNQQSDNSVISLDPQVGPTPEVDPANVPDLAEPEGKPKFNPIATINRFAERFHGISFHKPNLDALSGNASSTIEVHKHNIIKVIGLAIILAVIGFAVYTGIGTGSASPQEWIKIPQQPVIPLDFVHSSQPGIVQVMIGIICLLVATFTLADAYQRGESGDAVVTGIGIVVIVGGGLAFIPVKNWIDTNVTELQFTTMQMNFLNPFISLFTVLFGAVFTIPAFAIVYMACKQGRRADWTPEGGFLTTIGALGILFGTTGLGSLGTMLLLPHNPVIPVSSLGIQMWNKDVSNLWTSLVIYTTVGSGAFILAKEGYRSIKNARGPVEMTIAITGSVLFLILYPIGRHYFNTMNPLWIFGTALGICALVGLQTQVVRREAHEGHGSGIVVAQGEVVEGREVIPPFDKLAWQLAVFLLYIALTGAI